MKSKTRPLKLHRETLKTLAEAGLGWAGSIGETHTGACRTCYISCQPTNCQPNTCPVITCPC